ncbi:MAG: hypothetical protein HY720_02280 [Planctomycetes bacterium]|nr:hypothetical protein [Planctomycetota bacterium]
MRALKDTLVTIAEERRPLSIRHLFYVAESAGHVAKTEKGYATIKRATRDLRMDGEIPFSYFADSTRWMRKPQTFDSLAAALADTAACYRRSLWRNSPDRVEIWTEKDAVAGILYEVTERWDVPLMVARGYSSLSFLHSAAMAALEDGRPAVYYHVGDWDPSGQDAARDIEAKLRRFTEGKVEIRFERLAVTEEQIAEYGLPTRPTKKSDPRSKKWKGDSVEVDTLDPRVLREIVDDAIRRHVDADQLATLEVAEESERRILDLWAGRIDEEHVTYLDRGGNELPLVVPRSDFPRFLARVDSGESLDAIASEYGVDREHLEEAICCARYEEKVKLC